MTKKDSEKEVERPHYYSQFWLDVAAGRRIIGTPKTDEGVEALNAEMPDAVLLRKPAHNSTAAVTDEYQETLSHAQVEPTFAEDEFVEPELEEELAGAVDDLDIPNIVVDEPEVPEIEITAQEEEEEPLEDFFEDEEEEEEEDWTISRGRKKAKPSRPTKQPPKRPEKRRRF